MTFWDTSAIVPLLVEEPTSKAVAARHAADPAMLVWWATEVECASALCRLEREGALASKDLRTALARLDRLASRWFEVLPVAAVRDTARRLLRVHPLRAADALQLGAAIEAAEGRPSGSLFLTFDLRLQEAALREGFDIAST